MAAADHEEDIGAFGSEHVATGVATERQYSARAAISNAIVRIHARSYGRGPTKARTFLTDDYAMCVLEHIFTAAERTLIEGGAESEVHQMRRSFQRVVADQFIEAVEEITHRKVRAFFSNVQHDPDIAIELFLFDHDEDRIEGGAPSHDGQVPHDGRVSRDGPEPD